MRSEKVAVAALAPFWRYAVGPTNGSHPALPFYRRETAEKFFKLAEFMVPFGNVSLYRRRWPFGIETIQEYRGTIDSLIAPAATEKDDG